MAEMKERRPELVEEALLVSRELIRVAVLWHEMWHEGLEEVCSCSNSIILFSFCV